MILNSVIIKSGGSDIQDPRDSISKLLQDSRILHVYLPFYSPEVVVPLAENTLQGAHLVLPQQTINKLRTAGYDFLLESANSIIKIEDVPDEWSHTGILIADDHAVCLLPFSDRLRLLGLVKSERQKDIYWGKEKIETLPK